jgi:hypothetical protein
MAATSPNPGSAPIVPRLGTVGSASGMTVRSTFSRVPEETAA